MLTLDYTRRDWTQLKSDLDTRSVPGCVTIGRGENRRYVLDVCASFDIEVTSMTMPNGKPLGAVMYAWVFAIDGVAYTGRTWSEYEQFRKDLEAKWEISGQRLLYVYVHNLAYEYQFFRRRHRWCKIFATKEREVVYAESMEGIVYKCSYKLTLAGLEYVASDLLHSYQIRKLVGALDYSKPRGPWTPLTEEEWAYIVNDGLILNALIDEYRAAEKNHKLTDIPLTKTGFVRRECREACLKSSKDYAPWIKGLRLTKEQYQQLNQCAGGGFTHSSVWHTEKTLFDVTSYDIASSYPTVMICEKYPMSDFDSDPGVRTEDDLEAYKDYIWYAQVTLYGVEQTEVSDMTLSVSKCETEGEVEVSNGRILTAEKMTTWITNVDYDVHKDFYHWSNMEIQNFNWSVPGYLPRPIVEKVLEYYRGKTELKGRDPIAYARSKERVNSIFGMMLTDPIRDTVKYYDQLEDDESAIWVGWKSMTPDIEEEIEKYNDNCNRFNWYAWGVWVTAYARRNVTKAIKRIGGDYIYCDTDSVKILYADRYAEWFSEYNAEVDVKVAAALLFHGFPLDAAAPNDPKGKPHPIGHFEFDGFYKRFKTLGAKRYLYEAEPRDKGKLKGNPLYTTVAGCGKSGLAELLFEDYDSAFDRFADDLHVPAEYTGKLTHTYGDYKINGEMMDYLGQTGAYEELSWVHLAPCPYHLGMDNEFLYWIQQMGFTALPDEVEERY